MEKIHYIGNFTARHNPNAYTETPSANQKMEYITNSLKELGYHVDVLSVGESNKVNCLKKIIIDRYENNIFLGTFPRNKSIIMKSLARTCLLVQIFFYLLFHTNKSSKVIFYYSPAYLPLIKLCKHLKNFNLILEIEEIYSSVYQLSSDKILREIKALKFADGYIVVNDKLKNIYNDKPCIVCYGAYKHANSNNVEKTDVKSKEDSNFINIVYAGLISEDQPDVFLALDVIELLNINFRLKIVGYGNHEAIDRMNNRIRQINENKGYTQAIYDGILKGDEFLNYLLDCDIGLNPRTLTDENAAYSFPSKLMTYLTCDLKIVSTPVAAIINSSLGDFIYFSANHTAESLAKQIINNKNALLDSHNANFNTINILNTKFLDELRGVLENDTTR